MAEQEQMGSMDFNMKNIIVMTILMITLLFILPTVSFAQGMMGRSNMMGTESTADNNHTAIEETKGKDVFNKLQSKQIDCKDLSDDDFEVLGEYFMGQMVGTSHEAMNTMMTQMIGKEGEEQMHITMGKRLSGCDTSTQVQPQGLALMPIMQMMMSMTGGGNSMMGPWSGNMPWMSGFRSFFALSSIISSILISVVLVLLSIWLWKQIKKK